MTDEETLKQAIEKVVKNGYGNICVEDGELLDDCGLYDVIFSHDFAEAFAKYLIRKNKDYLVSDYIKRKTEASEFIGLGWEARIEEVKKSLLTKMVLEEEPLLYLKKFL